MNAAFYIFSVAVGGAAGALLRGYFSGKLNARFAFPLGTFSANMLASFLTGAAVSMQAAGLIPESAYPLVDVGFCATLSTFSALSWEIAEMIKAKKFAAASAYASATFASGMGDIRVFRNPVFPLAFALIGEPHAMPSVRAYREQETRVDSRKRGLHGLRPLDAQNPRGRRNLVHEKAVESLGRRKPVRVYMREPPAAGEFHICKIR